MMRFTTGDILAFSAEALVNTVNCVGIMGRGIALQFKNAYPENFKAYAAACERDEVQPGHMFVFETGKFLPRFIINFPTKRHWRGKSRIEDVEAGLVALREEIVNKGIRSIAIPPLGSGLGGLDWKQVRPLITATLANLPDVDIVVFDPTNIHEKAFVQSKNVPKMTSGRAALLVLINQYLRGLMDPFVTLLEVHKLMYFMQEAGQQLQLKYVKAPRGPYAENLRHVLHAVEGHLVSGYADGGDAPDKQLELVPGAVSDAVASLKDDLETSSRFDQVAKLVDGYETPYGLELLATVHWIAVKESAHSLDEVIARFYEWGDRKKRFSPRQISLAHNTLREKGWLSSPAATH
jgi:O-acetyl-ADP-ribose deacetylase (regulator of RNase III)